MDLFFVGDLHVAASHDLEQYAQDYFDRPYLPQGSIIKIIGISLDVDSSALMNDKDGSYVGKVLAEDFRTYDTDAWVLFTPLSGDTKGEVVNTNLRSFSDGQARVIIQEAISTVKKLHKRHGKK